jgi:hypothetical protein
MLMESSTLASKSDEKAPQALMTDQTKFRVPLGRKSPISLGVSLFIMRYISSCHEYSIPTDAQAPVINYRRQRRNVLPSQLIPSATGLRTDYSQVAAYCTMETLIAESWFKVTKPATQPSLCGSQIWIYCRIYSYLVIPLSAIYYTDNIESLHIYVAFTV